MSTAMVRKKPSRPERHLSIVNVNYSIKDFERAAVPDNPMSTDRLKNSVEDRPSTPRGEESSITKQTKEGNREYPQ